MNGDSPPRCPDCSVDMEEMQFQSGGHYAQFVSDENKEGILGKFGVNQTYRARAPGGELRVTTQRAQSFCVATGYREVRW